MGKGVHRDWPTDDDLVEFVARYKTQAEAAKALGVPPGSLTGHIHRRELAGRLRDARKPMDVPDDPLRDSVRELVKRKKRISVEGLADELDVSPRRIRDALDRLRHDGYRVPEEGGNVELATVVPDKLNLHKSVLDGDEITFGVVSDTHLCSNEEALAQLELAYDVFAERGIREVLHAGDLVSGMGIFPTQGSEIKRHTFEGQVEYAAEHYPRRDGIRTRMISGNHDIEGTFGRTGANPVLGVANRRDDIDFLGDYSAWVELPNGAYVHLLHGKGGMSYAFSYKAQKLVDGYAAGRKPALLIPGHWHVTGNIEARGVQVLWPGCFEWRSKFLERIGLSPSVGFWIVNCTLGEDGSLVRFRPEWFRFWEGRHVVSPGK